MTTGHDCGWREGEARDTGAGPWPAAYGLPRSRRGPGVKPFTPDSPGPSGRDRLATVTITTQTMDARRGRADRDALAGLTLGGRLRTIRTSPSRAQPLQRPQPGQPCRAPAARRARGAKRERAHSRMQRRRVRALAARLEQGEETLNHTLSVCHEAVGGSAPCSGRRTGVWRRWARIASAQVSSAAVT